MGSAGKKRGRRTRSDRGGRRTDVAHGVDATGYGRAYDPPWRSISEGRGLPRTPIYRSMIPVLVICGLAMLVLVVVGAAVSALLS